MPKKKNSIPVDIRIAETHEYVQVLEESRVRIGITEFAAEQLGEVVFVDLPEVGYMLEQGESFGAIESEALQSDLYAPVSGEVTAVNSQLSETPDLVNDDCYGAGWLLEVELLDSAQTELLMDGESYAEFIQK
jgi:glycine cleavage system H protein